MKRTRPFIDTGRLMLAVAGLALAVVAAPKPALAQTRLPMLINIGTGKAMDVYGGFVTDGTGIIQFTRHGQDNQRWLIRVLGVESVPGVGPTPTCAIIAAHSGRCLDVPNASTASGVGIIQYSPHFGPNQRWALIPTNGTNEVVIMNVQSRLCLEIEGRRHGDGARVVQQPFNASSPYQRWLLIP